MDLKEQHLPPGWVRSFDEVRRRQYFHNTVTRHSQWEWPQYAATEIAPIPSPLFAPSPSGGSAMEFQNCLYPAYHQAAAAAKQPASVPVKDKDKLDSSDEDWTEVPRDGAECTWTAEQPLFDQVASATSSAAEDLSQRMSAQFTPQNHRKAGHMKVYFASGPDLANKSDVVARWCIVETSELFVLPSFDAPSSSVEFRLALVDVCCVRTLTELQAGYAHAVELDVGESRATCPLRGGREKIVLVCASAQEQEEWATLLRRIARASRHWRTAASAPDAIADGLQSAGRLAFSAFGAGFGWTVGRNAGNSASRAVGLS